MAVVLAALLLIAGGRADARVLFADSAGGSTGGAEEQKAAGDEAGSTSASGSEQADEPSGGADVEASPDADDGDESARVKLKRFLDASRGLTMWNLFDDRVTVRMYARLQVDGTVPREDEQLEARFGTQDDSLDVRRLVVLAEGTIDHHIRYAFGYDLGEDRSLWNAYIEGIDEGLRVFGYRIGNFRAGFFQEPFSLERMTSSSYGGFLERSLPSQTFGPGNNIGYQVFGNGAGKRMSWAAGFFSFGSKNDENASNSTLSVTTRLTALPVFKDEGRRLVHVGIAYSTRSSESDSVRYRSRPEARFVDYFADTGEIDSSTIRLYGLEVAAVSGPFWLQSEAIYSRVAAASHGSLGFWGSYLQVGYFLTGEYRPYHLDEGVFGRVVPGVRYSGGVPFRRSSGGAFELTARVSNVDLDDRGVAGGSMLDYSVGFNWHVSAASKVMLNYVRSETDDVGAANLFLLRYQWHPLSR